MKIYDHDSVLDLHEGPWVFFEDGPLWVHADGRISAPGYLREWSDGRKPRWIKPRWLTPSKHPNGYCYARTKQRNFLWHRVIALTWLLPPDDKARNEVHHIDFDTNNNSVENLMWVTHSENVRATIDAGRGPDLSLRKRHPIKKHYV